MWMVPAERAPAGRPSERCLMNPELGVNPQQRHYEALHDAYEAHYYDAPSMEYRHRFIYSPLLSGLDLHHASVADLACGSGHNSLALRSYFPQLRTVGYDISETACRNYRQRVGGRSRWT